MYGIDQIDARLGSIVLIDGCNGAGKTSILQAILKMIEGGHDPGVLRRYCGSCNRTAPEGERCECGGEIVSADKARVEITLDNGCRFLYSCTAKTYRLEGWNETGVAIKAPKGALEEMISMDRVAPGAILKIDASTKPGLRQLRERLQELIPLQFSASDIEASYDTDGERESVRIAGAAIRAIAKEARTQALDLAGFDRAVGSVRESRQRINREQAEKDKTVAALQQRVSATSDDVGPALDAARAAEREETARWAAACAELDAVRDNAISAAAFEQSTAEQRIDLWMEQRFAEIRAEATRQKRDAASNLSSRIQAIEAARQAALEQGRPEHESRLYACAAEVGRLEEAQKAFIESEQTRKMRDEFAQEARRLSHESMRYDRAVELLETLRIQKLQNLPVPGLEVGPDYVRVDGVDWEKLNTAMRMQLCIRICAALSAGGDQKILFLDHAEAFDAETFDQVKGACADAGFQLILARVSDSPRVRVTTSV